MDSYINVYSSYYIKKFNHILNKISNNIILKVE